MLLFVPFILIPLTTRNAFAKPSFPSPTQDNSIIESKGNVVIVDVVGESKCPDTTRFFVNHLMPIFKKYRSHLQINYHPFGPYRYTGCYRSTNGTVVCECQHGPDECRKNALQACVIEALPNPVDHLDIVACIQGPSSFTNSFSSCIRNNQQLDQDRIYQCANSDTGRVLMAEHGKEAYKIADNINWVPWISINGLRIPAAERHFEAVLCNQYFEPTPSECLVLRA